MNKGAVEDTDSSELCPVTRSVQSQDGGTSELAGHRDDIAEELGRCGITTSSLSPHAQQLWVKQEDIDPQVSEMLEESHWERGVPQTETHPLIQNGFVSFVPTKTSETIKSKDLQQ